MIRALVIIGVAVLGAPACAGDLTLPVGAQFLSERQSPLARYALPTGPAADDRVPVLQFEGQVRRRTWRLDAEASSLQVLAHLRQQLQVAGYDLLFQCQAQDCGGFDFRFGIEVVPAPDMTVNIGDYQFLSAIKGEAQALSVLVSSTGGSAYIQVIEVAPSETDLIEITPVEVPVVVSAPEQSMQEDMGLIDTMMTTGRTVLVELEFETGSARLGAGPFPSLALLAAELVENPEMRVSLVGHTDNVGAKEKNVALSLRRAEAVRERMLDRFELNAARVEVAGAGYISPLTSNLTAEGREVNRRVEVVLLSE